MPVNRLIYNRFIVESLYRFVAYLMLCIGVLLYYFAVPFDLEQAIIPLIELSVFVFSTRVFGHIKRKYNKYYARQTLFVLDAIVLGATISAMHCSIVFAALAFIVICHIKILLKISFITASFAFILSVLTAYLNAILFFGFENYFSLGTLKLTIYSFICFGLCAALNTYFSRKSIEYLETTKDYYKEQMNRYVQFSNQLSLYAPRQLWQAIMSGETEAKIEYKRKKMTVFFSDIQGFTELAEKLIPDDLAFLLNDYLSHMTEIAKKHEATLDKFIGDGILIFFGDPYSHGIQQDAKHCIDMAISMRQQMHILRERWKKMGFPELHIRMGISTGYCHVGNYGSDYRMSYTLIGQDVNLAARLQTAANIDEILVSNSTYQLVKDEFICLPKAQLDLKGVSEAIQTWQVIGRYTGLKSDIQQWFNYEYNGFHLLLNLEEIQHFEYKNLIQILEKMTQRLKLQQSITTDQGVAKLGLEDEVIEYIKH